MKERPILFTGEMVRAIFEGHKTQTRRVIKPEWIRCLDFDEPEDKKKALLQCPYGQPGDRLWVRETWQPSIHIDHECPAYKATGTYRCGKPVNEGMDGLWRPSIFMPRWASRINLEITGVRVERVQEISAQDALDEGIADTSFWTPKEMDGRPFEEKWWDDFYFFTHYPQIAYSKLWNSINAKRGYSWESNPWVWVIEFKVL